MAKIIINRSSEFSNILRSIEIFLDNEKIGEIKDGESKEFEIAAGNHALKAKIDWCSSNLINLNIKEEEILRYNLSGRNPFLALFYITLGKDQYLELKPIK
ncbi:YusG family protein [Chryseobacterium chendengshani]|uniref:YusG family protein n=1 Tax=Chryseobacterium sp. LJ668 TaxID=2864040 RepID=UPI001C692DB2|nr:YusG family protein [Chryseobacterium sp. LJ668]MBW8523938.1 YusG family protein [Chryseobacterium sp. LJ668]QYK16878.1 YusG family protein [Chryseobacterium sp. LJ668]